MKNYLLPYGSGWKNGKIFSWTKTIISFIYSIKYKCIWKNDRLNIFRFNKVYFILTITYYLPSFLYQYIFWELKWKVFLEKIFDRLKVIISGWYLFKYIENGKHHFWVYFSFLILGRWKCNSNIKRFTMCMEKMYWQNARAKTGLQNFDNLIIVRLKMKERSLRNIIYQFFDLIN